MLNSPQEFLTRIGVSRLKESKVLRGETNLLNGHSLNPLLQLMQDESIEQLNDDTRKWYLMSNGQFSNPKSPSLKTGNVSDLANPGDVFWLQNRAINPHYKGPERATFIDQFDNFPLEVMERIINEYPRDPGVRRNVLKRASGVCELCGEEGFRTTNGEIFLESHHVTPLSEHGKDCVWNVVALCPNDHRRAHHAHDREQIRLELERRLKTFREGDV